MYNTYVVTSPYWNRSCPFPEFVNEVLVIGHSVADWWSYFGASRSVAFEFEAAALQSILNCAKYNAGCLEPKRTTLFSEGAPYSSY